MSQAKLSLAQQMCHDKKLSLLKTQHMIELLHKSQAHISANISANILRRST